MIAWVLAPPSVVTAGVLLFLASILIRDWSAGRGKRRWGRALEWLLPAAVLIVIAAVLFAWSEIAISGAVR
jgi:Na+/melibiose symporter-like transporter